MKEIIKFLVPPIIFEFYYIFFRVLNFIKYRSILKKNYKLKKTIECPNAVFVGNGPSLKKERLDLIKNYDLIVCNDFYLHDSFYNLKIKYYINLDPTEKWILNISKILEKVDLKNTIFILPIKVKNKIDNYSEFKDISVFYISAVGQTKILNKYFINISKSIIHINNIVQFIMIFTNFISYKNVYFLGVDMDFLAHKNKSLIPHFYSNDENVSHIPKITEGQYTRVALNVHILFMSVKELNDITKTNFYNTNQESFMEFIDYKNLL